MIGGRTERLAAALVARHELTQAIKVLNGIGVIPMPLKGVLLQHTVYSDPSDRPISDADLLVPTRRGEDALDALRAHGYVREPAGQSGVKTTAPNAKLAVDVHWRVFPPGLFDLRAAEMFARGRIDEQSFGGVVVVPDPLDVYAHLVGNFAKGRAGQAHQPQLRDFSAVASRFGLAPRTVARHLERHGLSRAARYTLGYARDEGDRFAGEVLRVLRRDVVGRASARVARRLTDRFGPDRPGSVPSPHLVNRTLLRGVYSGAAHVAIGLRARLAKRLGRDDD